MIAYGYDIKDPDNAYFMLWNSWGEFWGDKGNMKWKIVWLKENLGLCHVASQLYSVDI